MSSTGQAFLFVFFLLLASGTTVQAARAQTHPAGARARNVDPQILFQQGEAVLKNGKLDEAERAFRAVLEANPQVAGAYGNLGVVYMRRKQWLPALEMLHKAETLAPSVAGVRLNIGLAYYRQNDFRSAIAPFESVVRDVPGSFQASYLLGLCYFFTKRYSEATTRLAPLWAQASDQLNYLYGWGLRPASRDVATWRSALWGGW